MLWVVLQGSNSGALKYSADARCTGQQHSAQRITCLAAIVQVGVEAYVAAARCKKLHLGFAKAVRRQQHMHAKTRQQEWRGRIKALCQGQPVRGWCQCPPRP